MNPTPQSNVDSPGTVVHVPRVLVVDDEDGIRQLIRDRLVWFGYSVEAAASADAALAVLATTRIDVAVCDIRMPGKDGVWLMSQINERHPDTAIVIATGIQDMPPSVTLGPGVVSYLRKPFDADQLGAAVRQASLPIGQRAFDLRRERDGRELPEE